MPIDKATAVDQIDAVLARRDDLIRGYADDLQELITLAGGAIRRLAPAGSVYIAQAEAALSEPARNALGKDHEAATKLVGILRALRADWEADRLRTFRELIHADLFSDFLEMAEYFLEEGFKDPAAVIAGGVLEEHLRKLCGKHGVTLTATPNLNTMNAELARIKAYSKNDQKQVTAWAGIRNEAAHGHFASYAVGEVKVMVAGIRDLLSRNPA